MTVPPAYLRTTSSPVLTTTTKAAALSGSKAVADHASLSTVALEVHSSGPDAAALCTSAPTPKPTAKLERKFSNKVMGFLFGKGGKGKRNSPMESQSHESIPSPETDRRAETASLKSVASTSSLKSLMGSKSKGLFSFRNKKDKKADSTSQSAATPVNAVSHDARGIPSPPEDTPPLLLPDKDLRNHSETPVQTDWLASPVVEKAAAPPTTTSYSTKAADTANGVQSRLLELPDIAPVSGQWRWSVTDKQDASKSGEIGKRIEPKSEESAKTRAEKHSSTATSKASSGLDSDESQAKTKGTPRKLSEPISIAQGEVKRTHTARSTRSSSSESITVIPEVLSPPKKQLVSIGGTTIEAKDPSHLFWVPAHLHPELHPSEFTSWLSDSDPTSDTASKSLFPAEKKPLKRSKSFVERHVVITPDNADKFMEDEPITRARTVAGLASTEQRAAKGLPPLKRARHIKKPVVAPLGGENDEEQEGYIPSGSETAGTSHLSDAERARRRKSRKSLRKRRGSRKSNKSDKEKKEVDAEKQTTEDVEEERIKVPASSPLPEEEKRGTKEDENIRENMVVTPPPLPVPKSEATDENDSDVTSLTAALEASDNASKSSVSQTSNGKKPEKKPKTPKSWNWLGFLHSRKKSPRGGPKHARSASMDSLTNESSGSDWDAYPADRDKFNNPGRLPAEDEKYIYRISHVKIAETRRSLYHQVLISNQMLYILSVHADVTLTRRAPQKRPRGGAGGRKRTRKSSLSPHFQNRAPGRTHPLARGVMPLPEIPLLQSTGGIAHSPPGPSSIKARPLPTPSDATTDRTTSATASKPAAIARAADGGARPALQMRTNNAHLAAIKSNKLQPIPPTHQHPPVPRSQSPTRLPHDLQLWPNPRPPSPNHMHGSLLTQQYGPHPHPKRPISPQNNSYGRSKSTTSLISKSPTAPSPEEDEDEDDVPLGMLQHHRRLSFSSTGSR
ncbi:uncharacterized protein EV422DRAFT_576552 [Fimicolochytrium jonesii]|uniref:uncharacterized protein n=1 Tax=Fimicolochytrium jonesii TaxID=1396493 RepID=UPI0022FF1E3E|nr:uncharacterized protein EV422DRAFT_576552 [Fimicolochytrium jonesii]KAI8824072.1 hypothetical protein EV422DRAFT_576552 [Fimicolochytrium jonesii]